MSGKDVIGRLSKSWLRDDRYIADMLIPLTPEEADARLDRLGISTLRFADWHYKESAELFTCRHWDETTRLCTAYESRPAMCSEYPYERPCEWCGKDACKQGEKDG